MPVCFQLFRKGAEADGPVVLQKVDEELCEHFGVPCDPVRWLGGWYESIGFRIACGKSFAQIREEYARYVREGEAAGDERRAKFYEALQEVLGYLEDHFTTNSFYTVHKD